MSFVCAQSKEAAKGRFWFVETDLRSGSAIRMDKTGKSILMLLRHLGRLQEVSRAQGGSCCKADCQTQGQTGVEPKLQGLLSPSNMMVRQLVYGARGGRNAALRLHADGLLARGACRHDTRLRPLLAAACRSALCWSPPDQYQRMCCSHQHSSQLEQGGRWCRCCRCPMHPTVPTCYRAHQQTAGCMAVASVHWHSTVSCFSCCWPCFLLRL